MSGIAGMTVIASTSVIADVTADIPVIAGIPVIARTVITDVCLLPLSAVLCAFVSDLLL